MSDFHLFEEGEYFGTFPFVGSGGIFWSSSPRLEGVGYFVDPLVLEGGILVDFLLFASGGISADLRSFGGEKYFG